MGPNYDDIVLVGWGPSLGQSWDGEGGLKLVRLEPKCVQEGLLVETGRQSQKPEMSTLGLGYGHRPGQVCMMIRLAIVLT